MDLSNTVRPHIAYCVSCLARYMQRSTAKPWKAGKSNASLSERHCKYGLMFRRGGEELFRDAFEDSDWGQVKQFRKSVSGNSIMCAGGFVEWRSKQ